MAKKLGRKLSKSQLGNNLDDNFKNLFKGEKKKVDQALIDNPEKVVKELAKNFAMINLSEIERNPDQPRYEFEETALKELAESIKIHGIIQPLTVRYLEPKRYQIISGERRWRASEMAELKEVPAYIRVANDQTLLEMAIIENIQREDLNAMEIAQSYSRLKQECALTDDQLAERVGKQRSTITNYLRVLKCHASVQEAVKQNLISVGHTKAIAGIDLLLQEEFLNLILAKKWSVRKTEAQVKNFHAPASKTKKVSAPKVDKFTAEHKQILQDFKAFFGSGRLKIQVEEAESGKGQIVIPFDSHDQLNELFKCIEQ